LNWGFILAAALPSAHAAARAGDVGAAGWRAVGAYAPVSIILPLFGFGFPILYFLVGQRYGMQAGLRRLYDSHKDALFRILIERLQQFHEKDPDSSAAAVRACEGAARLASLTSDSPRMARMVFDYALKRRRFRDLVEEVRAEIDSTSADTLMFGETLTARLDDHLRNNIFDASPRWLWTLLAGNAVALLAALSWLRRAMIAP
jgi:hypothetical protein